MYSQEFHKVLIAPSAHWSFLRLFSYFFIGFGALVFAVCIYLLANTENEGGFKFLPWLMMIGAAMIIFKHVRLIYLRRRG